tara:strand:+ start:339 stop:692 length:354 start_codon:yes stop_codon:yes gene_type:complete
MCDQIKTLAKNYNGKLSFCENCELYQLIFNNIYIEFSIKEFELFKNFVAPIEVEYWEHKNENLIIKRKISIGTLQENLSLIFCKQELKSLKDLVSRNTKRPYEKISLIDIDYNLLLN